MIVTIEKYDIVKGVTYKRKFNLDTNCIVLYQHNMTIATIYGDFNEMSILCRDSEKVDFISVRVRDNHVKDFTCYSFDTIKYFDSEDEMKILICSNGIL